MRYADQVRTVFAGLRSNGDLRRVQLAFAGYNSIEWAVWIAMLVYAYDQGGAATAGLVALAQLLPSALFAPYAGMLGDRHPRGAVLVAGYLWQGAAMTATAVALALDAPWPLVWLGAMVVTLGITITRPTQSALLPELVRTPDELTASNVVAGWVEAVSVLVAPALTGVVLAVSDSGAVFGICGLVAFACAAAVAPLARRRTDAVALTLAAEEDDDEESSLAAGLETLRAEPAARLLVLLLATQFIAIGALDVLFVVLAIDTLALGESWTGYLNAAFGAGGVLGILATVTLVGRARLLEPLMVGIVGWAAALAVLAAVPTASTAIAFLAAAGLARTVVDVAGRTLLQRAAPPEVLARVFGILEGLQDLALALGSLLVPALVALGGASAALVGLAALLPLVALVAFRGLRDIDRRARVPVVELSLLRCMPIFAGLSAPVLESLARSLEPRCIPAGDVLIRQGDPGDRFYAIAGGELDVLVDGVHVRTVERGDGVGENALVRDVPRTATVGARTEAHVYALEKGPFLAAVTGHPPVERAVEERLAAT